MGKYFRMAYRISRWNVKRREKFAAHPKPRATPRAGLARSRRKQPGRSSKPAGRQHCLAGATQGKLRRHAITVLSGRFTAEWFGSARRRVLYSYRSAAIGSVRKARRAGFQHDNTAAIKRDARTISSSPGSLGEIPYTTELGACPAATASTTPAANPNNTSAIKRVSTSRNTWEDRAPTATLMPISRVLRETA